MKKLLIGILILFLVALVPSVMAASWSTAPTDQSWLHDNTHEVDLTLDLASFASGDTLGLTDTSGHFTGSGGICTSTECKITVTPLADWAGAEDVTFWINDGTQRDAPGITNLEATNNDPVATAYTPLPLVTDEDNSVEVTLVATDADSDDLTYLVVDDPDHGVLSAVSGDKVAYTPNSDYEGSDQFTFKVNDGVTDSNTLTVSVTVTAINDAPVLEDVDEDYTLHEKLLMSTLTLPEASDVDDLVLTYTLEVVDAPEDSTFDVAAHYDGTTLSGWEPTKDDVGELKLRLVASDGELADEQEFSVHVYPKYMCEEGEVGTAFEVTIEEPEDNDDFGPGDMIPIEVTVDNEDSSDKDVVVVAMLYDLEDHKKIAEVESDDENLDEDGEDDEEFTFNLELQVPLDSDEDYDGDYVLYVKVYEEGEEDNECLSRMVELDLSRESHEVIIQSMTITPSTVNPGDTVDISVSVLNVGKKDEDSVLVKLRAEDLRIDLTSEARNLGAFDELGRGYTFTFRNVEIPSDADAETVDFSDTYVLFDSGAASTSYLDSPTFNLESSGLTVEESSMLTTGATTAEPEADEVTEVEEEGFPWSTVLWVLGDVVLIIVALFFLKLIFSGRRRVPEVKEVKL